MHGAFEVPYKFHQLYTQLHQVQPHKCFFVHYIWVRLFLGCIPGGVNTTNPVSDWTDSHKEVRHHSFCCFLQVDSKFAKESTTFTTIDDFSLHDLLVNCNKTL